MEFKIFELTLNIIALSEALTNDPDIKASSSNIPELTYPTKICDKEVYIGSTSDKVLELELRRRGTTCVFFPPKISY